MSNNEALTKAFERIHKEAELDRSLEKSIVDDYLGGLTLSEITKKNNCTYKRVESVIRCYFSQIEDE